MFFLDRWDAGFLSHIACSSFIVVAALFFVFFFFFLINFIDVRSDYLRISDGSNRIVGTYCGYQTNKRVSVGGSIAVLKFHTDGSVRYPGFYLSFSFSPRSRGE